MEEVGLDLNEYASYIGEIDWVQANPLGRSLDMVVAPFVYGSRPVENFTPIVSCRCSLGFSDRYAYRHRPYNTKLRRGWQNTGVSRVLVLARK